MSPTEKTHRRPSPHNPSGHYYTFPTYCRCLCHSHIQRYHINGTRISVDAMSESARREESSEGGSSNTNNSVAAAQGNKPTKHLKRALTGTIGAGLAVAAALLLIRSEEIGDWLQSVTPHVLPNAAVGAEILQMALAEVKTCFQEGVNVCLDAEGGVTALCESHFFWEALGSVELLVLSFFAFGVLFRV